MTLFTGEIKSVTINGRRFDAIPGDIDIADRSEPVRATWSVQVKGCPLSIRQLRLLTTGRPRPRREETKELNRQRRALRKLLVADAGDVSEALQWGYFDQTEQALLALANGRRVSVPRSLRHALGRYVGGGR